METDCFIVLGYNVIYLLLAGLTGAGGTRGLYCQMCVCVWFKYAMQINNLLSDFKTQFLCEFPMNAPHMCLYVLTGQRKF